MGVTITLFSEPLQKPEHILTIDSIPIVVFVAINMSGDFVPPIECVQ